VHDVAVFRVGEAADEADLDSGGRELLGSERHLDTVFDDVGKFGAADGEEFDAVVGSGVVRRGDHDAEVGLEVCGEECRGGSGDDPGVVDVDARTRQSCGHCCGDELSGYAGIPRDNSCRPAPRSAPTVSVLTFTKYDGCRLGKPKRQLDRQIFVRETANTVCAEEPWH
jgi:hypothetical protein